MSYKVTVDGITVEAEAGEYILDVAKRAGAFIPTLCHHEGIRGIASCRLCVVEVDEGRGPVVQASCVYPVQRDCKVFTSSEKILRIRRTIFAMLRDRAPASDMMRDWADSMGVPANDRFTPPAVSVRIPGFEADRCVLCGRCAKACEARGSGAISTMERGVLKRVSTPYDEPSPDCVGCGACAEVCPTGAISMTEKEKPDGSITRSIWGKDFELVRCEECGKPFATREEIEAARAAVDEPHKPAADKQRLLCRDCRREEMTRVFAASLGA